MNRILAYSLIIGLATLFSCKKDETKAIFTSFTAPELETPSVNTDIVITADNNNSANVVKFKWSPADYGLNLGLTYTLTADSAGVKKVILGTTNTDSLVIDYATLNTQLLTKLGANVKIPLLLTVSSILSGNNTNPLYSAPVEITVTTYKAPEPVTISYLYIAGDFQSWSGPTVPIASVTSNKVYEGYIYIPTGGTYDYKLYTTLGDWNSASYGDSGDGTTGILIVANYAGSNLHAPAGGYYEIGVDLNKMTWSQTATTWSILGDATPGGWTTDTDLTYDVVNKVWTCTVDMKTAGSFKFRANHDWKIDFGLDSKGNLTYADNPILGYNSTISNITVPADGTYKLTLDLSKPGAYTYSAALQKKK